VQNSTLTVQYTVYRVLVPSCPVQHSNEQEWDNGIGSTLILWPWAHGTPYSPVCLLANPALCICGT